MGSCGCGDWGADYRLPIKQAGAAWALQIHDGCEYCDVGPRLIFQRHKKGSGFYDAAAQLPQLDWGFEGDGYAELVVPIIDGESLWRAISGMFNVDEYDNARDLATDIRENATMILRRAVNP